MLDVFLENELSERLKQDRAFAKKCYVALCNISWHNPETGETFHCTMRVAAGLIADIRDIEGEDYIDFYLDKLEFGVHESVKEAFGKGGWVEIIEKSTSN